VFVATNAGAVPVSVSLHESQSESSHTTVFMQVRDIWLSICPAVVIANFMTDDSKPMKSALTTIWPHVRQLLCLFHVPQALWRWLCDIKNGVLKEKRQQIMSQFSDIIHCRSCRITVSPAS